MRTIFLNGRLVTEDEARVSPFDRGFLLGDGVFETMRAYGGAPFALDEHLARLTTSCAALRLPMPQGLPAIVADVLRANGLADAAIRVTVTRGPGGRGASPRGAGPPTLLVTAVAIEPRDPAVGVRLVTARQLHSGVPGMKTTNYAANIMARIEAEEAGADDALFVDAEGRVIEATQANVFVVRGNELVTPPLASGCLPGVTRSALLRLAPRVGLRPAERALTRADLLGADEALLTASILEVAPIVSLDGARVGGGARGRATEALHAAYRALATGRLARADQNESD